MTTIEQIELQKCTEVKTTIGQAFNNGINIALEILQAETVIRCKALRKNGTDLWYFYDGDEWCEGELPIPFEGNYNEQVELDLSSDAELIDIEIHIPNS